MSFSGFHSSGSSNDWSELEGGNILSEINITPLTDIFLVLLIIFMVTSSVMSQLGMDVDIPSASQSVTKAQPDGVILTLLPDGKMKLNSQPIPAGDWEAMKRLLTEAFQMTESRLVILEGDRKAYLGSAIEVMDHARQVGAASFAVATSPK